MSIIGKSRSICLTPLSRLIAQTCTRPNRHYQQQRFLRLYKERTVRAMYFRGRSFDRVQYPEVRRNQMTEWNYKSEIYAFSRRLHENLSEDMLRQIFAHPSYVRKMAEEQEKYNLPMLNLQSNQKLVERGDILFDDCVKPYLRSLFERVPEEGIASISSYLKSTEVLSNIAAWIGCKDIILTGEYPPSQQTMADTVKALLAGIETEFDITKVRRFVADIIISYLNDKDIMDDVWTIPNPKETLNLILANNSLPAYEPRLLFQTSVNTLEPCHIVGLYVNQKLVGSSAGETLQIAETCAALDTLQCLFDLKDDRKPFVYGEAAEKIQYDNYMQENDSLNSWRLEL